VEVTIPKSKEAATTSSSDDDYAGVDLLSDDEEDEPDVEEAEERLIIDEEQDKIEDGADLQDPLQLQNSDGESSPWDSLGLDDSIHTDVEESAFFDAQWELSSCSSEDDDDEDNEFPDLFLDQDRLDPFVRSLIENDDDGVPRSSDGEGSYWDLHSNEEGASRPDYDDNVVVPLSASGYAGGKNPTSNEEAFDDADVSDNDDGYGSDSEYSSGYESG
jgi:hypothetical protein